MRKVLSFVLVLALVLGSFSMAFAATPTDVVGQPSEDAVVVLMGLGVVDGYTDGTFKPAQAVTRAEMAKLIVVALGLEDYAVGTSKFSDMAGATWAQGYVNYAAGLGVILGYPDGTFKPSQTVSYDEAAAMLVRALGYTDGSLLPATWPANYVVKAKSLGILDDVSALAGGANRGDIAQMVYNTLSKTMVTVDLENKITANTDTMLARLGATAVAAAVITGTEDSLVNLVPFIGTKAKTWKNSDGDIVSVEMTSTTLSGKFNDAHDTFTANKVDYTVGSNVTTAAIAHFSNGAEHGTATYGAITSVTAIDLAVSLSGKTITSAYAYSTWTTPTEFLYEASDYSDITGYDKLQAIKFALDVNDNIDLNSFMLVGAASLKDIAVDDVVYVYTNPTSSKISKIEVGTATVTGKVTRISSDSVDYYIGGVAYGRADNGDPLTLGDTGTAKLDYNGDIYDWVVDSSTAGNYAMVLGAQNQSGLTDAKIKLFTKDGDTVTYTVDSDATTVATIETTFKVGVLARFSVDSTGVVDALDYLTVSAINSATKVSDNGTIYASNKVASNAVVFTVTSVGAIDTVSPAAVGTVALSSIANIAGETTIGRYYIYDGSIDVLVVPATLTSATGNYAVLNIADPTVNTAGDAVKYIEGFLDGVAFNALTDTSTTSTPAVAANTLYTVTKSTAGVVTDLVGKAPTQADTVLQDKAGNLIQAGSAWYEVSSDVIVYKWSAVDGEYTLSTMTSLVKTSTHVQLYNLDTTDDLIELIILTDSAS